MRTGLIVAVAALTFAGNALGGTIRVDFGGSIYDVDGYADGVRMDDPEAALGGSVQIGGRFSGYFILDDATAPEHVIPESADPLLPEAALYLFAWPASVLHIEVGDFVSEANFENPDYPTGGFSLEVQDNELYTAGAYESLLRAHAFVGEPGPPPGASLVPTQVQFDLVGTGPGLPLHSTSLATFPWNRTSFPTGWMRWSFQDGEVTEVGVTGSLDQLSASPVPEPGVAALIAVGAAAFSVLGFRRARS